MPPEGLFSANIVPILNEPGNTLDAAIDDAFTLPYGNVKLFCQRLKTYAVNISSFYNFSITLREYVLVNIKFEFANCHLRFLVPLLLRLVLVPLVVVILTVCFAIIYITAFAYKIDVATV